MRAIVALAGLLISTTAFAGISLFNSDGHSYKLLLSGGNACFTGTQTSIASNTATTVSSKTKYICLNETTPAYRVEDGKDYVIRDGELKEK